MCHVIKAYSKGNIWQKMGMQDRIKDILLTGHEVA